MKCIPRLQYKYSRITQRIAMDSPCLRHERIALNPESYTFWLMSLHKLCANLLSLIFPEWSKYTIIIYLPKTCTKITITAKSQVPSYWVLGPFGLRLPGISRSISKLHCARLSCAGRHGPLLIVGVFSILRKVCNPIQAIKLELYLSGGLMPPIIPDINPVSI